MSNAGLLLTPPPLPARVDVRKRLPKQFGTFDTLSDRRDLFRLLERLGDGVPAEVGCQRRREFLAWCCRQAGKRSGMLVAVDPKTIGLAGEVYADIVGIASLPGYLDIEAAAVELERIVRKLGR